MTYRPPGYGWPGIYDDADNVEIPEEDLRDVDFTFDVEVP